MKLPIRKNCCQTVGKNAFDRVNRVATQWLREHPEYSPLAGPFTNQRVDGPIDDSRTLHIDDFSEIPVIGIKDNSHVLQQRARLRAVDGDYVVQSRQVETGFSDYCEYGLGLGRVHWMYPAVPDTDTHDIALECWQDRRLRHDLEQAIRHDELRYIHPHISTFHVWELAALLTSSTRMPIKVIGPPPAVSRLANDKIEFAAIATRILGEKFVPRTTKAFNLATLAKEVSTLAENNHRLGVKFPNGTGGTGNFLIRSEDIRGKSLAEVRSDLKRMLLNYQWPEGGRLLVDVWETHVINSPSVQAWIPADGFGEPIIEGVFVQAISGEQGNFVGTSPSNLPEEIEQKIVDNSFLLATFFQRIGYVGRCSFDLILVGSSLDECRIEFIECNARWGGTSAPMTLMNRLRIPDAGGTYSVRKVSVPHLSRVDFASLKRSMSDCLFDSGSQFGQFILINPASIQHESAIDVIAVGDCVSDAEALLGQPIINHLQRAIDAASDRKASFLDRSNYC